MTKLVSSLILAMFAAVAFNAQAASHAGGAPMKASEAAGKASGAMKKDEMKKDAKKDEMKKEEPKK